MEGSIGPGRGPLQFGVYEARRMYLNDDVVYRGLRARGAPSASSRPDPRSGLLQRLLSWNCLLRDLLVQAKLQALKVFSIFHALVIGSTSSAATSMSNCCAAMA